MDKKTLFEFIENQLKKTVSGCKFKRAWIPEGWACVEIKEFSKHLTEEIDKEFIKKD